MQSVDCAPANKSDIKAIDKRVYYQLDGDKNGVKKGAYRLTETESGAVGWCLNYRENVTHGWSSKAKKEWTAEEKAKWKADIAAKKAADERDSVELKRKAAELAQSVIKRSKPADNHPYLERKGIKAIGAMWCDSVPIGDYDVKNALVIPSYKDGKVSSLQAIAEDGTKLFLPDGDMNGAYGVIKSGNDLRRIYICEGFATGASVHEAMNCPVIIAFNAGNLPAVTKAMRSKYPDSEIIIAADNDRWSFKYPRTKETKGLNSGDISGDDARWDDWRDKGLLKNAGIDNARAAAVAIGGARVVYPEFDAQDGKPTDWNDGHKLYGLEWVRDKIQSAQSQADRAVVGQVIPPDAVVSDYDSPTFSQEPPLEWLMHVPPVEAYEQEAMGVIELYESKEPPPPDVDWRAMLHYNDEGKLTSKSLNNVQVILEYSPKFKDMFAYDEFAHEKILVQCPDWENPKHFKPRPICDEDNTWLAMSLEKNGLTLDMGKIKKILDAVIIKKRRNPAREYFNSLEWDGIERLNKWLTYYAGAEFEDPEYLSVVGTKWIVACVTRVFEPATKFDHVLILEGEQGARKSTMLKELATIRGRSYFDDTIKVSDLGEDKTVPKLQGVLIIELAEMAGLRKSDVDKLKQQITITEDRLVRKYANEATRFPRQFVMAGTINPVQGYLEDPTGNRRFLPVKVGRKIDIEAIARDKEQLWAEAVHLYRQKYPLWIDDEMMDKLRMVQISREIINPWLPDIEVLVRGKDFVSNQIIWETLGIEKSRRNQKDFATISKIMVGLGYKPVRKRFSGVREYGWQIEAQEVPLC